MTRLIILLSFVTATAHAGFRSSAPPATSATTWGLGDGTSSAPSLYFSDDTNTGIYSPANDGIAAVTGSYTAWTCGKSTGNFGNCAFGGDTFSTSDIYSIFVGRDRAGVTAMAVRNLNAADGSGAQYKLLAESGQTSEADITLYNAATTLAAYDDRLAIRSAGTSAGISLLAAGEANSDIRFYSDGGAAGDEILRLNGDYSAQLMQTIATPANPSANSVKLYVKNDRLTVLDDGGNEIIAGVKPWYVQATLGGDIPDLGVSDVASYTEMTAASLTLTPISGSAAAGAVCAGTNAATAPSTSPTTCAAGNESVGLSFALPADHSATDGYYEVCSSVQARGQGDAADEISLAMQLIETPTNAQTLTLEGGMRTNVLIVSPATDYQFMPQINNCSIFNWTGYAAGTVVAVRLMYELNETNTPDALLLLIDNNAASGQRNAHFSVKRVR